MAASVWSPGQPLRGTFAENIAIVDIANNFAAENVEAALAELQSNIDNFVVPSVISAIYVDPRDTTYSDGTGGFGISPAKSAAQNTAALTAAMAVAAASNAILIIPPGIYNITQLVVLNGCRGILGCGGCLKLNGVNLGLCFGTPGVPATVVSNCTIEKVWIDANNIAGPTVCIWAANAFDVRVLDNVIVNVAFGYGILFRNYTASGVLGGGDKVQRNKIFGTSLNTAGAPSNWFGIFMDSEYVLGGAADEVDYWRKNFTDVPVVQPQSGHIITDNRIVGGYYGLGFGNLTDSVVANNNTQNNQRGISLQHSCVRNTVIGNYAFENKSSGIHLSYGSSYNNINGNTLYTTVGTGEALIQGYIGTQYNKISDNVLINREGITGQQHAIYFAVNASHNTITNNTIIGKYSLATIAIASAWNALSVEPYRYSTGSDGSHTAWMANTPTLNCIVKDNVIHRDNSSPVFLLDQATTQAGASAGTAIWNAAYLANYQAELSNITIDNNIVLGSAGLESLRVYEDTALKNLNHMLLNNRFTVPAGPTTRANAATYFIFPRGRAHFLSTRDNFPLDNNSAAFVLPAAAIQDVSIGYYFAAGGGACNIVSFTGGIDGQEIRVRLDIQTGLVHTTGGGADTIRMANRASVPWFTSNSDEWFEFRRQGGVWFETSRSQVTPTAVTFTGSVTALATGVAGLIAWTNLVDIYTEVAANVFTCKQPGLYAISALIRAGAPIYVVGNEFNVYLYLNGALVKKGKGTVAQAAAAFTFDAFVETQIQLVPGDTISFYGFSNWGGAGAMALTGAVTENWATITRVDGKC